MPNHSVTCLDKREPEDKNEEEDSLAMQINQLEKVNSQTPNAKRKKVGCTCSKTNCLKRYCECFSIGKICGIDCACSSCFNTSEHEELIAQAKA